jgi:hypothetical protein
VASGRSNYLLGKELDKTFSGAAWTPPDPVYVALFTARGTTAQAAADTNFTEVTGGSYARVEIDNDATTFPAASGTPPSKSNGIDIVFPEASAAWGTVTCFGIYDDPTAGNLLGWGDLASPRSILNGDTAQFSTGALVIAGS